MTNFMNIFFITTCCILKYSFSLELTKISIPTYRIFNDPALLECHYQLNTSKNNRHEYAYRSSSSYSNRNHNNDDRLPYGRYDNDDIEKKDEKLYSVKWYKDNEEFYTYVPRANPPQRTHHVEGVKVDLPGSNDVKVLLKRVNLKSGGVYRCEISAEAPSFSTVGEEGRMEIVYLPKDGPVISGEQREYQIGDTLYINCTSGKSLPSSTIQWFINDEPVLQSNLVHYPNITHTHGLVTTILGLRVILDGSHFRNGSMRVKCLTSVLPMLTLNTDGYNNGRISYAQRRPPPLDNREAMLLVRSSSEKQCVTIHLWKLITFSLTALFLFT